MYRIKSRYLYYVHTAYKPSIFLSGWNAEIQKAFITFVRGQEAESAGVSSNQVHTNTRYLVSTYLHLATACWVTCHGVMSVDIRRYPDEYRAQDRRGHYA